MLIFFNLLKQKLKFKLSELNLFLILLSLLIIGIAFVGGPGVTGKNLLRLSNYSYFNLILVHYFLFGNNLNKSFQKYTFSIISISCFFMVFASNVFKN